MDKVKAKATLERKTMREVTFESLNQYIASVEPTAISDKRKKKKWRASVERIIFGAF